VDTVPAKEAAFIIPKTGQTECIDVLQGHEDLAMASENLMQQMEAVKECAREPSQGESESVETARVDQAATNKTRETILSVAIAPAPEVGSAPATDQLPLIQLVKTAQGWKASALPNAQLRAQDASTDSLAPNHTGTQKTSEHKCKQRPEGVLEPADVGRRLRPRK
jgi:hypothetical protein